MAEDVVLSDEIDAVILDMPSHGPAIKACSPKMKFVQDLRVTHQRLHSWRIVGKLVKNQDSIVEWAQEN